MSITALGVSLVFALTAIACYALINWYKGRGATIGIVVGVEVGGALVIAASIAAVIFLQRSLQSNKRNSRQHIAMEPCSRYEVEAWLESGSSAQKQSWHKGERLREAASSFHHRYAREPERLRQVSKRHTDLMENFFSYLRGKDIPVHPQYVGSAYEGVKVAKSEGNDDLEFDILVTMKLPKGWKVYTKDVPRIEGHVFLYLYEGYSPAQKKTFFDKILTQSSDGTVQLFIDGQNTIQTFFGEVQNWIDSSLETKGRILPRRHGPAVQIDVYEEKISSDPPLYTVDLVPTLEIEVSGENQFYVAKPVKSRMIPDPASYRQLLSRETDFRGSYNDERVDKFTPTHLKYISEIETQVPGYRLRFAGHRIGANDNNLEFRVLVIDDSKANQIEVSQIEDKPDFVRLNKRIGQTKERVNSRKETTKMVSAIQEVLTSSLMLSGKVLIRREGSTVRLLILCESEERAYVVESCTKAPLFYVDVILTYEVGGKLYAAKPKEDWYTLEVENSKAWRRSYSTEAKDAIHGSQYGCLKMVFRILKVIRNREVALAPLTSYHLKTVFLWLIRKPDFYTNPSYWNEIYLGERLMDALLWLEKCLKEKNFPHFRLDGVNLTSHMVDDCINSMGCRIHTLCTNERQMMQVLQAFN